MPNKKSAKKELRKSDKRRVINQRTSNNLKKTLKVTKKQILAKDEKVKENLPKIIQEIDKAVKKKIIKKNTASRQKSRIMKKINNIKK